MSMIQELYSIGLIPVIKIDNADDAVPLAKARIDGGLPAAEITFRTACAAEAIAYAVKNYPDMEIGAGTVINAEQCEAALEAGATFIVSPGLSPAVAKICTERNIPYYPGCVTPTEIMAALGTKSSFRVKKIAQAAQFYSTADCVNIITWIRECDTKSKGLRSRQDANALLRELVYKILLA